MNPHIANSFPETSFLFPSTFRFPFQLFLFPPLKTTEQTPEGSFPSLALRHS